MVDIPPGVTTGSRLPVAIADGPEDGLSYGDLVLAITVVPHQTYECRGADLYVTLQVDRASALREGRIEVSIEDGRVLAVPIQPGTTHSRFVYAGQGLPRGYAPRRYGDLILRLELLDVEELIDEAPENGEASQQPRLTEARVQRSWWQSLFGM